MEIAANPTSIRDRAIDVGALALLSLVSLAPLAPAFGDSGFWLAAIGGVFLGTTIAVLMQRFGLGALEITGAVIVSFFLFGGLFAVRTDAIAGFIPSLKTLADLAFGAVFAWKQLLTVSTPAIGFDQLLVVPYLIGLLCATLSVSFALRLRRYGWALVPVAASLTLAISLGDYVGLFPAGVGALLAVGSLAWLAARASRARAEANLAEAAGDTAELARARTRRLLLSALTLTVATALSVGVAVAATGSWQRWVVREQLVPPLELHDYASPLMSFRGFVENKDQVMFTATDLPQGSRIRVATMDLYDGIVYKVSGSGGAGSGTFNRVGRAISGVSEGDPVTVTFQIGKLGGVWIPDVGYLTGVSVGGPRSNELSAGLHYNRATGTLIDTASLAEGDTFAITSRVRPTPEGDALAEGSIESMNIPAPIMVPDALQDRLDEAITGVDDPLEQVQAICTYLHDQGYFSHGLGTQAGESRAGHTWERINTMLGNEEMVGDQEQYAVAAALMTSQLGIPVRVVMGFAPKAINSNGPTEVKGGDITAWIEVPVQGKGWVAFDPSPPEDKLPKKQVPLPRKKPQPQVPQPPQPPQEPAQLPPQPPAADDNDADSFDLSWLWRALGVAGISLGVLAVIFGPGLAMGVWRTRRRRGRRQADWLPDRVSGGWSEVLDTARDAGVKASTIATRRETAELLTQAFPAAGLQPLAARADQAIFGEGDPSEAETEAYWADVDTARTQMDATLGWKQKLRRFFWPASVISQLRPPSLPAVKEWLGSLPRPGGRR